MTSEHQVARSRKVVQLLAGISTMDELWEIPDHAYLIADGKVWRRDEYILAQGMSSARNGTLFTDTAKVLLLG